MRITQVAALAATICFASLLSTAAQAGVIYDLTVAGGGSWTGSGSITFDTLTGNTTAGVSAFSFHVDNTGSGGPQDYNLADIATVDWSIDPTTFDLSLLLTTNLIPFGVFQSAILLTNQPGLHANPCGASTPDTGSLTCARNTAGTSFATTFDGQLSATFVSVSVPVPEPSTLALFGLGLAGLGWVNRRRKA